MNFTKIIIIGVLGLLISSCEKSGKHEKLFMEGSIENGVYKNDQVGISITIPDGWETANYSAINEAKCRAAKDVRGFENYSPEVNGCYTLLAVTRYPLNNPSGHLHNPTLTITAKSKDVVSDSGIFTLHDDMAILSECSTPPFFFVKGVIPIQCSNTTGLYAQVEVRHPQITICQDVGGVETENYFIDLVVSTIDADGRKVLMNAVNTITLRQQDDSNSKSRESLPTKP